MRKGLKLFARRSLVLVASAILLFLSYCCTLQMIITLSRLHETSVRRQWWANEHRNTSIGRKYNFGNASDINAGFRPAFPFVGAEQVVDGHQTIDFDDLRKENDWIEVQDPMFSGKRKAFVKDGSRRVKIKRKDGVEQMFEIPICPDAPTGLCVLHGSRDGRFIDHSMITAAKWLSEEELSEKMVDIGPGGNWRPEHCISRHRLAVIIPFRNRSDHLPRLFSSLIPILQRQLIDFRFIVVEQFGNDLFNKGRLFNAAFTVAEQLRLDCVIFHDVDLFPNDDRNPYGCSLNPRHMGAFVDTLGYELLYSYLSGGVLTIRMEQFKMTNGYSNMYWGWGGEDDDMGKRIKRVRLPIERPDTVQGRMTMLKHEQRKAKKPLLIDQLVTNATRRMAVDGYRQQHWRIIKITRRPLYYHVYVDVGVPPEYWFDQAKLGPARITNTPVSDPKWLASRRKKAWQRKNV